MLFVIFVPYSMLPLPLKWCIIGGSISGTSHLISITIVKMIKANAVSGAFLLLLFSNCSFSIFSEEFTRKGHSRNYSCNECFIIDYAIWTMRNDLQRRQNESMENFSKFYFHELELGFHFSLSLFYRSYYFYRPVEYMYVETATRVYGAKIAVERFVIFGHQFCRDVYKVSNGSRSTLGIHGNTQSHGVKEGFGEGVSAHPETTRLKWVCYFINARHSIDVMWCKRRWGVWVRNEDS